jgi:hypothetical protein
MESGSLPLEQLKTFALRAHANHDLGKKFITIAERLYNKEKTGKQKY